MTDLTPSAARRTSQVTVHASPFRGLAVKVGLGEKDCRASMVVEKWNFMLEDSCWQPE